MTAAAPSMRSRALLAVGLTVTFYLLAIVIALALIALPIAVWAAEGRGNIWVTIAMVGTGLAILRAIVPERARFEPPGPELTREAHPRLHALLDDVAEAAGERGADAVYLDADVNASVFEHRRRRIMLLGLPLLATLAADELRAVIAHEYGHFKGGDTRFSAWIWRTRVAVLKTVARLAESESWFRRNIVRWPFELYAKLFLRITNADSRRAEFAADALAARVASPDAAGRALRRVEAVGPVWEPFWLREAVPLLEARRRPPLAAGFAAMTAHRELASALDEIVQTDIKTREPDPYASHPTLRQRLEALGVAVEASAPPPAEHPAVELLDDVAELEGRLLGLHFGDEVRGFPLTPWEQAGDVHLQRLRELGERFGGAFGDRALGDAAQLARDLPAARDALRAALPEEDRGAPDDELDAFALEVLGACAACAAVRGGATVTAPPGEPIRLHHAGATLEPWALLAPVAEGRAGTETWTQHPVVAALAREPLHVPAQPPAPAPPQRVG